LTLLEAVAVLAAGVAAGTINTVVGSGTLITFPVLLAVGYSPVTANVSNTIGLVPGSVSGAIGYRRELEGQRERALRLGACSFTGAVIGAILLLVLPDEAFEAIVPVFIALALVGIVFQPALSRRLAHREARNGGAPAAAGVLLAGIYGGYFGAAQGILLMAILGPTLPEPLQRVNALKNVLGGLVNAVAGVVFIVAAHVAWLPVALIAAGSTLGGVIGARYGRRLPPAALRALIIVVGIAAIVRLL
jgi:uncharacterized membrane protein YfcA